MLLSIENGEGKLGIVIKIALQSSSDEYSANRKRKIVDLPKPMSPMIAVKPCLVSITKRDLFTTLFKESVKYKEFGFGLVENGVKLLAIAVNL